MAKEEQAANVHKMMSCGEHINSLTGEIRELLVCPICGYMAYWVNNRFVDIQLGEGMITELDALEFATMCDTHDGREKIQERISVVPRHSYIKMPTSDEFQEVVKDIPGIMEFEAIEFINESPPLELSIGGVIGTKKD